MCVCACFILTAVLMSEASSRKVIVIGDGAVGKTCFVSKVTENKFIPNYLPTLGGKEPGLCAYYVRTHVRMRDRVPWREALYVLRTL